MKNNKGFSMVELIIVIAIMAIIAGLLAPKLIQYVNKSRLSSDVDTGKSIATGIMTIVAENGDVNNNAGEHPTPYPVNSMDDATFKAAVFSNAGYIGSGSILPKAKKDINGDPFPNNQFYYTLDSQKNKVEVFLGGTTADYRVYPGTGSKISD